MYISDEVVMQEKEDATTVTWSDYQHLRQHLLGAIKKEAQTLHKGFHTDLEELLGRVGTNEEHMITVQQQLANLQTSINTLQASVESMRTTNEQRFQNLEEAYGGDDGSIAGDNQNQNAAPHGRGIGAGQPTSWCWAWFCTYRTCCTAFIATS